MAQHPTDLHHQHHLKPVVDIEAIEHQKENIQPIRSGRSAAQLVSLFSLKDSSHPTSNVLSSSSASAIDVLDGNKDASSSSGPLSNPSITTTTRTGYNPIELIEHRTKAHEKFQHQIRILEDALDSKPIANHSDRVFADELMKDPLEIYLQYIRWTIESYPSGGSTAESRLIPLLEQATRKFMHDKRYHQDLRYLKCWIFYSDQVNSNTTPSITTTTTTTTTRVMPNNLTSKLIFNFLIHNRIGTKTSLLYQEYFKLFLPIDKLNSKSNEGDRFKLEQVLKFGISQTTGEDQTLAVELLDQLRSINRHSHDENGIHNDLNRGDTEQTNFKPVKLNPKRNNIESRKSKSKTKIKIYEDSPGASINDEAQDSVLRNDSYPNLSSSRVNGMEEESLNSSSNPFSLITKWDNLGTVNSNRKQNTIDPSSWKGQKLPMKSIIKPTSHSTSFSPTHNHQQSSTSRPSKIKVYEDRFSDEGDCTEKSIEARPADDLPPIEQDQILTETRGQEERDDHRIELDDLITSEINNQIHSIHHHYLNGVDSSDDYQVLKFDPLKFHSL